MFNILDQELLLEIIRPTLNKMQLVTREEFEIQKKTLATLNQKIASLQEKLKNLENKQEI